MYNTLVIHETKFYVLRLCQTSNWHACGFVREGETQKVQFPGEMRLKTNQNTTKTIRKVNLSHKIRCQAFFEILLPRLCL